MVHHLHFGVSEVIPLHERYTNTEPGAVATGFKFGYGQ